MANYRDFFVAAPEELPKLSFPRDIAWRPRLAAKEITSDTIGLLDFLLTKNPDREPQLAHEVDGIHVYEVARELGTALVKLPEERFPKLLATWGFGNTSFLADLKGLARIAHFRRQRLYVCVKPETGWKEPPLFRPPPCPYPFALQPLRDQ